MTITASSILAALAYNSYYLSTAYLIFFTTNSIWNGGNFYMEYFAKKYEKSLKQLEEIQNASAEED